MKIEGLTEKEAAKRLSKYGRNELQEAKRESIVTMFLRQFKEFMILLLIGAAIVAAFLGEITDAVMIFAIVLMLGILGFIQEYKAEKAFEALKRLISSKTRVLRNGEIEMIDVHEVVPGDVVLLESGDRIPADGKVLESVELAVDEAPLTGESIPVRKDTKTVNKVFMGTAVVSGRGTVVIEKTGMQTEIGKIADMVQFVEVEKTPLEGHLNKLGKQLSMGVIALCVFIFVIGILYGFEPFSMFLTAVSLAVAAIPEGLPAVVTIALALGVQRMSKRNAIVRKLKSVETLGSANIICTDKTGTLTKNEMTVRRIFANNRIIKVGGSGYDPSGKFTCEGKPASPDDEMKLLMRIGALCNSTHFREIKKGKWSIIGDPTEGALLVLAAKAGMWKNKLERKFKGIGELPFDSERKRMTTVHKDGKKRVAYLKGAPESVIEVSSKIIENGKVRKLTDKEKKHIMKMNDSLTSKGYRTLAFGYREIDRVKFDLKNIEKNMIFVGIVGMIDSPREEVKPALDLCRTAGIRVIMITGDHPLTAKTIADELGITDGKVVTGDQIDKIKDKEFSDVVEETSIFARVSPEHKLRIVNALGGKGYIVAMTGDGVNDAPALKKSDIGVAMGITGTDVAKESSDLILTDDNFATIVSAVEEGRGIYENIRKTLAFLISGNIAEIAIIFLAVLLGMPLPLIAIQILWINLVTDGLPAIALSADPIDKSVMWQPPRRKEESIWKGMGLFIIEYPVIITLVMLATFVMTYEQDLVLAQTMIFTMIVMFEKAQAFACRSLEKPIGSKVFDNKWLVYATILTIVLHLAILYTPFLNELFSVKPLSMENWAVIVGLSILLYVYLEIRKYFKNKQERR